MAEELEDGSQSRAGSGARHRGGGAVGLAADGPRRREGGRPGRGRRDAPGAQQPVDRGHGRDRRGRARRGADALYRREGRHRAGPEDRHRARSARRHDDHRQGRRPTRWRCMAMAEHGGFLNAPDVYMDKIAVGGGLPDGIVDLDDDAGREPREPGPGQEGRCRRPRRLHPRPAAPCRADRQGARGRRPHHADRRRRLSAA